MKVHTDFTPLMTVAAALALAVSGCAQTTDAGGEVAAAGPDAAAGNFMEMTPQERFQMMASGPRMTHCDDPVAAPELNPDTRYDGAVPPACSTNVHGQTETLAGGVEATHWFVEADGVTWHFVTAGDPANEAVIFLHGLPESWYGFNHQMTALSDEYYTISIDQMGYGQSDKRLELDFSNPGMAAKLAALIDTLGIETFNAVGHDRGAITFDYLMGVDGMSDRVLKYVRMQQSGNRPHGEPRPPHKLFASQAGIEVFARDRQIRSIYSTRSGYSTIDLPPDEMERFAYEFLYEGAAEAISENFKTTGFDKELEDRTKDGGLFDQMTMPVLFLQGALDPGQHPEEYQFLDEDLVNAKLILIEDASHFAHVERPEKVSQIIRDFLAED
ncbi:MAG: alpha/beta hydrolase [Pseudomonadota bacterium]